MYELARRLLAEKLIDDFYEDDLRPRGAMDESKNARTEELKQLLPVGKWDLLFLWESQTVEECANELRRFADFVSRLLMEGVLFQPDRMEDTDRDV